MSHPKIFIVLIRTKNQNSIANQSKRCYHRSRLDVGDVKVQFVFTQIKMYLKLGFVLDCEFLFVEQVPHVQQARQLPARLQGATAEIFTQFLRSNQLVRQASSAVCLLLRQQECCGTLETICAVFSAPRPTQTDPQPAG